MGSLIAFDTGHCIPQYTEKGSLTIFCLETVSCPQPTH